MADAQQRDGATSRLPWKARTTFEFPLGGNSLGLGGSSFGDQPSRYVGMVEQVSLSCVGPPEVLIQNISLEVFEDTSEYSYQLNFRERPAAPNGLKTVVVSQAIKLRVRFGFGGFGIGFNVWNGSANTNLKCTATLSGYAEPGPSPNN